MARRGISRRLLGALGAVVSDTRLAVALEALRALEWSILDFIVPCCPECSASEYNGHSADCKIGRALAPEVPQPSPARPPRPTEGAPFIKLCLDGAVVAWLSAAELAGAEPPFLSWIVASRRFDDAIGKLGFRAPEHLMAVGMSLSAFHCGFKLNTESNGFPIERDPSEPWRLWDDLRVNVERVD